MSKIKFFLITIIFILLAHYLAVFPHEFAHSLMAVILGDKNNFLDIDYGGKSIWNLLLLINIEENVNYSQIYYHGIKWHMALIGFAGPGLANGSLYIISLLLLKNKKVLKNNYLFYFIFWFNFMNLANLYDYVPIRTFTTHGDIAHITLGLGISPYYIYIFFGYIVAFTIWHFFTQTMVKAFVYINLNSFTAQASLMVLCVLILFIYFGLSGLTGNYGEISYFLSATSLIVTPGAIAACWPTREWVKRQILFYNNLKNTQCI